MDQENRDERDQEFLGDMPERFSITEEEIDPIIYQEFYEYLSKLPIGEDDEDRVLQEGARLIDATVQVREKKEIIVRLAQLGTVKAYRLLERYLGQADGEFKHWGRAGIRHCQMLLEGSLSDKSVGRISTGLGGKDNRLRYILIVGLLKPASLPEQKRLIEEAFHQTCQHHHSAAEGFKFTISYVQVSLLVSMDIPVGQVIDESIQAINERAPCLHERYFVTNVNQPTEEEVQQYLSEL